MKTIIMSQPANILELMKQLLASMEITNYEPAVPHMLVELFYRHVTEVLKEAQKSCEHRKALEIGEDDLKAATSLVLKQSMKHTSTLERMQAMAKQINQQPLPAIPDCPELVFPAEENSLMEPNFQYGAPQRQ